MNSQREILDTNSGNPCAGRELLDTNNGNLGARREVLNDKRGNLSAGREILYKHNCILQQCVKYLNAGCEIYKIYKNI